MAAVTSDFVPVLTASIIGFIVGYGVNYWQNSNAKAKHSTSKQIQAQSSPKQVRQEKQSSPKQEKKEQTKQEKQENQMQERKPRVPKHNGEHLKMVFVVLEELKMGKGKIASQIGHAVLGVYKKALKKTPQLVQRWDDEGQAKVAVKIQTEPELLEIQQAAKAAGLVTYIVLDAGRTQIAFGSKTVLGIGPDTINKIDKVTGHLKLL